MSRMHAVFVWLGVLLCSEEVLIARLCMVGDLLYPLHREVHGDSWSRGVKSRQAGGEMLRKDQAYSAGRLQIPPHWGNYLLNAQA